MKFYIELLLGFLILISLFGWIWLIKRSWARKSNASVFVFRSCLRYLLVLGGCFFAFLAIAAIPFGVLENPSLFLALTGIAILQAALALYAASYRISVSRESVCVESAFGRVCVSEDEIESVLVGKTGDNHTEFLFSRTNGEKLKLSTQNAWPPGLDLAIEKFIECNRISATRKS